MRTNKFCFMKLSFQLCIDWYVCVCVVLGYYVKHGLSYHVNYNKKLCESHVLGNRPSNQASPTFVKRVGIHLN